MLRNIITLSGVFFIGIATGYFYKAVNQDTLQTALPLCGKALSTILIGLFLVISPLLFKTKPRSQTEQLPKGTSL